MNRDDMTAQSGSASRAGGAYVVHAAVVHAAVVHAAVVRAAVIRAASPVAMRISGAIVRASFVGG